MDGLARVDQAVAAQVGNLMARAAPAGAVIQPNAATLPALAANQQPAAIQQAAAVPEVPFAHPPAPDANRRGRAARAAIPPALPAAQQQQTAAVEQARDAGRPVRNRRARAVN